MLSVNVLALFAIAFSDNKIVNCISRAMITKPGKHGLTTGLVRIA